MINGPMVGGFLIALTLIGGALFAGTWFASAITFQDAHSLDASRASRPVACSFNLDDLSQKTTGFLHARDGLMRFDIHNVKEGVVTDWGVEVNMFDPSVMMTRSAENEPYVSLNEYANLKVQVLDNLNQIIRAESLHCAPWWSQSEFRFAIEGKVLK